MARRTKKNKKIVVARKSQKTTDIRKPSPTFRWGESYTSLLLGIIVVIIGILFFASLVKSHHLQQVTSIATNIISTTTVPLHTTTTIAPSMHVAEQLTQQPSFQPSSIPTSTPTPKPSPTEKPSPLPTIPSPIPTLTAIPTQTQIINTGQKTYTVVAGDDLWHISEKFYKSGYNYVDIAKANNLENPGNLYSGTKLIIPTVTPEIQTVLSPTQMPAPPQTISQQNTGNTNGEAIKTNTYTVQKDDTLWNIAVRAYGTGYKWTDIAKANNLTNPGLIFSGNTLQIPR